MDWNNPKIQIFFPELFLIRGIRIMISILSAMAYCWFEYIADYPSTANGGISPSFGTIVFITFIFSLFIYAISFPLVLFHHKFDSKGCSDIAGIFAVYSYLSIVLSFVILFIYIYSRYRGDKISIWVCLTPFLIAFALQIISRVFVYFSMTLNNKDGKEAE